MKKYLLLLVLCFTATLGFTQVGDFTGEVSLGDDSFLGEASFSDGTYTIKACGSDIWGNSDGFYWVYKEISGNWIITVDAAWDEEGAERYADVNVWRKMGIMARAEPESAESINVMGLLRSDLAANLQWRSEAGGGSDSIGQQGKAGTDTDTIRLVRTGSEFTLLRKTESGTFRTIGSQTVDTMPDEVYYGLAVTAHEANNIESAKFSNLAVEPIDVVVSAVRTLPQDTFLPNSVINNIKIEVTVEEGKTADVTVKEMLPAGWSLKSANPSATSVDGSEITWELAGVSGTETITYSINTGPDQEGVVLSGSMAAGGIDFGVSGDAALDLEGADQAFAPLLTIDTTLDGKISDGEYEGAYVFSFDRENERAPGVLLAGPSYTKEESNATVHIFHNDEYINAVIDVVDPSLEFHSAGQVWENDSSEMYLDGDFSRLATKDGNEFGFQATVKGDGSEAAGNNPPTPIAIGSASQWGEDGYDGNYSEDGSYWNFGARVKDDGTGYIVEYKVMKEFCLYPLDIDLVGFDFGMNDNVEGSESRAGKWAWWHFDADTGQRKDSWNDERGWGELELLQTSQLPGVNEWSLY